MKKQLLLSLGLSLFLFSAYGQQKVKDGTIPSTNLPNKDALFELESSNKGLLHTRVNLTQTTNAAPLSAHVAGMMVYNLATVNDVVPGIYYNDGTRWVYIKNNNSILVENQPGKTGTPGIPGEPGGPGSGVTFVTNDSGTWVYNPATNTWTSINGTKGDKGDQGPIGLTGATGAQGPIGLTGATGAQGIQGLKGDIGLTGPAGPSTPQTITHTLTSTGNTLASDVNGINPTANIINTNVLALDASNKLTNTINGVASNNVDLSNLVTTADNGLTKTAGNTQLGGDLIKPTTIVTNPTNTLALIGLQTGTSADRVLVADSTTGVLKSIAQIPVDLRLVQGNNHITQDAGISSNGTSLGSGINNIAIGKDVLKANTSGKNNVAIGSTALISNTTGNGNLVISTEPSDATGNDGTLSKNTTGNYNIAMGGNTLAENISGEYNIGLGAGALNANTLGNYNTAIGGMSTLGHNTTGNFNVALGVEALQGQILGSGNVALGANALYNFTGDATSIGNIGIGYNPGNNLRSGSDNIFIGRNAIARVSVTGSNQLNIGNWIFGDNGKIGLGTAYIPTNTLHIKGGTTDPVRFEGLKAGAATDNVVVVDATGLLKTVPSSALATEPFQVENTTTKATTNAQNIYQNGNIGIGDFSATKPLTKLDVRGAVRAGIPHADELSSVSLIGANSASFGQINKASGVASFAAGNANISSGAGAISLGSLNEATGSVSLAAGNVSKASGFASIAMGYHAEASGYASVALGKETVASSMNSTSLGWETAIKTTSGGFTDASFQLGEGPNNNLLTILKNAHTAIGVVGAEDVAKPTELLDLGGTANAGNGGLKIRNINSLPYTGNITTDNIVVADATGVLKTVASSTVGVEPWFNVADNLKATANTQNIYQMGNVGIQNNNPNSTLAVTGSVSHSIRVITANDAANGTDYTIVSRAAGAVNLILPDPSTCTGRIYYIINNGGGAITTSRSFEVSTGQTQNFIPQAVTNINSPIINFGNKYQIQSDGTTWVLLQLG